LVRSIFISRNGAELPLLTEFCLTESIDLTAKSFVRFEPLQSRSTMVPDVVFFSSIRAAEFYLVHHRIESHTEIATIGVKTADKLRKLGLNVHFTGSIAGDPEQVAHEFAAWLHGRKVLIPSSDRSNRSIAIALPKEQVEELVVYQTITFLEQVTPCELYIFSSPSNLEAFLELNTIPSAAQIIAWGKTTEKALIKNGYSATWTLSTSSEEEILQILKEKK
jgi:uroporphyrinogen-III synthase